MLQETRPSIVTEREILFDIFPSLSIHNYLSKVWDSEFGSIHQIVTEERLPSFPNQYYGRYESNWSVIALSLEKASQLALQQGTPKASLPLLTPTPDGAYSVSRSTTENTLANTRNRKPLTGISILNIGGIEGRILADFGAKVTNIDPLIDKAPVTKERPSLTEVADYFDEKTADEVSTANGGPFDIVTASWLFDQGSGLDPSFRFMFSSVGEKEISVYRRYLNLILSILKKDGHIVANGNMLHYAARDLPVHSITIYPLFNNDTEECSSTAWVIKK